MPLFSNMLMYGVSTCLFIPLSYKYAQNSTFVNNVSHLKFTSASYMFFLHLSELYDILKVAVLCRYNNYDSPPWFLLEVYGPTRFFML